MGCILEFIDSLIQWEFNHANANQKLQVDILLRYSQIDINQLASLLDVSHKDIQSIREGTYLLDKNKADDLAQQFLMFLGTTFFTKFTLIRNYVVYN